MSNAKDSQVNNLLVFVFDFDYEMKRKNFNYVREICHGLWDIQNMFNFYSLIFFRRLFFLLLIWISN